MKRIILAFLITAFFSAAAFAAKYKVNTSGRVTSPEGKVQQNSVLNNQTNLYKNYYAPQYVNSQKVLSGPVGTIDIVMDYSGSMLYWIQEAQRTMSQIIAQLPASTSIGFRVFGQNGGNNPYTPNLAKVKEIVKTAGGKYKVTTANDSYLGNTSGSCSATKQVVPISSNNIQALSAGMGSVNIGGSTPLTFGLHQAVTQDFGSMPQSFPKKIVLITDGGENCGGDPCEFARELMRKRNDIHIDVVLVSSSSQMLKCLADTTGGHFYTTSDISSFSDVLIQSMKTPPNQVQTTVPQQQPAQQYEYIDY